MSTRCLCLCLCLCLISCSFVLFFLALSLSIQTRHTPRPSNPHRQLWLDGFEGRGLALDKILDGYKSVADWPVSSFYKARFLTLCFRANYYFSLPYIDVKPVFDVMRSTLFCAAGARCGIVLLCAVLHNTLMPQIAAVLR